jgi:hypothetical protein
MMLIWAGTGNVMALHNQLSHQLIALVVQAELLFFLSLLTWIQHLRYTRVSKVSASFVGSICLLLTCRTVLNSLV